MSLGNITNFRLDMSPGVPTPIIHASAGDVGRAFKANLYWNSVTYDIQGNRVTIRGTKPDRTVFEYDVDDFDRDDSWVEFTIKEQMAIVPGKVLCELREYYGDDQIGSANFILDVETAVYDPEAASESYIPSFEAAIQEALETVADDIADLATAAAINDVKQYSDAASASATAAAGSATSAQTSAGTATTAAGNATSAAEEAEDSADRAEEAADSIMVNDFDRTPYLLRQSGGGVEVGDREYDTIVGGTIVWNQKCNRTGNGSLYDVTYTASGDNIGTLNGTASAIAYLDTSSSADKTITGHVYLAACYCSDSNITNTQLRLYNDNKGVDTGASPFVIGNWRYKIGKATDNKKWFYRIDNGVTFNNVTVGCQVYDLTQMFGSTIAEYIYSLEQATAGAGVAWFRQFFPEDYYAYNAGELLSVSGVSAHVMRDADDNIIGNYPLDDSLTLRGIPKLDGGNLYYDGDTYEADGTVTRKYEIVTITESMITTVATSSSGVKYAAITIQKRGKDNANHVSANYAPYWGSAPSTDGYFRIANQNVYFYDNTFTDLATAKTKLAGLDFVYELTTPTTETADTFTNPQVVDPDGTEQYVTDSIVPVGHDTRYRVNIANKVNQILEAPTTNGTYTLKCTVSNGMATYSWESS